MTVFDSCDRNAAGQARRPGHFATTARNIHSAKSLHRQGRLREAEQLYRAVLEVNESDFDCLHNLGLLHAQENRFDDAIRLLRAGARQDPRSVEAHNNLGNVLATLQRHDEAAAGFRIAIALQPDFAEAHNNLGNALAMQGRSDQAVEHFAQAVALRPDYAQAWLGLGNAFEQGQHYRDALAAYDKAPGLAQAWLGRARVLKRLNRTQEAVVAYRRALAEGGDPEIIRFFLASLGAEPAPAAAPKRLISTVYDQHAVHYDQHMVGTLKYRIPDLLLDAMARLLPSRKLDILDLGCGTGLLGARFRPLARTLRGVDISPKMLELARQRRIYDDLICGELVEFLQTQAQELDLVVAADVFAYIGDLSRVFDEARNALKRGGLFGFSAEAGEGRDFVLRPALRYAHSAAYLRKLSQEHGFIVETIESKVLRREDGDDVRGHIAILRRG
jgi:predicted TPR repeat methyltransferase